MNTEFESITVPNISKVKTDLFVKASFPNLNKRNTLSEYKNLLQNNSSTLQRVKIMAVASLTNEQYEKISNDLLMVDNLNEYGGACSEDERLNEAESIFQVMSDERLKKIWFETYYIKGIAILNVETREYFIVNSEGYGYARYVGFASESPKLRVVSRKEEKNHSEVEIIEHEDGTWTISNDITCVKYDPNTDYNPSVFSGSDRKDQHNMPRFYSKTRRSKKRAWKALKKQFTHKTTMHEAAIILSNNGVRTRSYCAMD